MKSKIRALLSDPGAMFGAAILVGIVAFAGYMGYWIKAHFG